jgi:hypothetical protein
MNGYRTYLMRTLTIREPSGSKQGLHLIKHNHDDEETEPNNADSNVSKADQCCGPVVLYDVGWVFSLQKFLDLATVAFCFIWQLLFNHGLIGLKRFVSRFHGELCN